MTLEPGRGADVTLTVENTSNVEAAVLLKSEVEGSMTGPLHVVPARIEPECEPRSSAPLHAQYALVHLAPGGKLQWTRRVEATRHLHVAALPPNFTGSGTPCRTGDEVVPKGAYDVHVANPIGPPSVVHVTVL